MSKSGRKFSIVLSEDSSDAAVEIRQGDKTVRKRVAAEELVAALAGTLKIDTGLLPAGARFFSGSRSDYRVGIEVPGIVRSAVFSLQSVGRLEKRIPFPSTFFQFHVVDKSVRETDVYACVPPLGGASQRLYRFPLGNVDADGRVCWGGASPSSLEIRAPFVLDSVVNRFFSSVFSGHYIQGVSAFHPPEGVVNLATLLDHLEGLSSFPSEILRVSDTFLSDLTDAR